MAAAIGLAVGGLAVVYPWVLDGVLARLTVRTLAMGLLALLMLSLPLRSRLLDGGGPLTWLPAAGLAALLAAAGAADDPRVLRLIPAWVYLCLAGVFAASLRAPDSIVERGARWLVPVAPTFIRSYCRKTTALWVAIFLAIALTTTLLALQMDGEAWRRFTSRTVWLGIGVVSLAEFLFRKSWFRYYARGGPFERFWSELFPAAHTERGRRSQAYIVVMREQQCLEAETERARRTL
jgi:uncharacterized membrane protein